MSKKAKFSVACTAIYQGELDIPDDIEEGNELTYIRDHLGDVSVQDLEWSSDFEPEEAVTEDDIYSIEDSSLDYEENTER